MHIKLFGGLHICQQEQVLPLVRLRERTLFTYLLLHPHTAHRREKLIELLWPEQDSERSGRNFATVLYRLQQVVGKQWIVAEGNALRFIPTPALTVDLWEFDRLHPQTDSVDLQQAVTLYGGDRVTMTSMLLPDQHDDWLLPLQTHYHECFLNTLQRLGQVHEQAQHFAAAQHAYQRLRLNDPLNEDACAGLMRVYARLGRPADVSECYHQLAHTLRQELAVAPSNTLRALFDTLTRTPTYIEQRPPTISPVTATPVTATAIAHNFPKPLTSLIGRAAELDQIGRLLANHRLITLTGAGGSGKTRLVIAVAHELADTFAHGAWWIDLSALTEENLVAQTILQALGLAPVATTSPLAQLIDHLAEQQCLLVLDNCEHLLTVCADIVETLLQRCADVQILTTSREPLGAAGEVLWLTPTLAMPTAQGESARSNGRPTTTQPATTLGQYAAIQLFVERARAVRQEFQLTAHNAADVLEICRRLDGIPLAIELAAVRIKVLTPAQIAQRLQDRFGLLVNPQRNALPRQQTLQALIDWSYNLLAEPERRLLRYLSVFAGGFRLEAAEAVCGGATLEGLARLVDKSMVLFFERQGEARYRLLETIRDYARQRLVELGEEVIPCTDHLTCYLHLAEQAAAQLSTPEHVHWSRYLEQEQDNLRAALQWAVMQGLLPAALRLVNAMSAFWSVRGDYDEARAWIEQALTLAANATTDLPSENQTLLAQTMAYAGRFAFYQTDYARATAHLNAGLALARTLQDHATVMRTLNTLGSVYLEQRLLDQAKQSYSESLHMAETLQNAARMAVALNNLGIVTHTQGALQEARSFFLRSLALYRQLGDLHGATTATIGMGRVATSLCDCAEAEHHFTESLTLSRQLGNKRLMALSLSNLGDVMCLRQQWASASTHLYESVILAIELGNGRLAAQFLVGLAVATGGQQQPEAALTMLAVAGRQLAQLGAQLDSPEQAAYDRLLAQLQINLPPETVRTLWQQGQHSTVAQAAALAQSPRQSQTALFPALTINN